jgi:aspartate 1-decarboxylase
MFRTMLGGKIHRATVTAADLHYIGSITVDSVLLKAANIRPFEKVMVVDVNNGNRLETYTISGEKGSGIIQLNGAAAHLIDVGDLVIIMSFLNVPEPVPHDWQPQVVLVNEKNCIVEMGGIKQIPEAQGE